MFIKKTPFEDGTSIEGLDAVIRRMLKAKKRGKPVKAFPEVVAGLTVVCELAQKTSFKPSSMLRLPPSKSNLFKNVGPEVTKI